MAKGIKFKINKTELKRLQRVHKRKASDALTALAEEIVTEAKMLIETSPATGKSYTRGSKTHIASEAGNPPRSDTGALYNSIHQESRGLLKRVVADGVEYGVYLEFGTEHIEKRQFMTPAVDHGKRNIKKIFDGYLDD